MRTTSAMHLSDPATFARAYDEHGPAVYGAALRVLGNPATAQDVAQGVFLPLWRRPAPLAPPPAPAGAPRRRRPPPRPPPAPPGGWAPAAAGPPPGAARRPAGGRPTA